MDTEEFSRELKELISKINSSTAMRVERLAEKHIKRALKRQEAALKDTYKEQGRAPARGRGKGKQEKEPEKEKPKRVKKRRYYSSDEESSD